MPATNETIDTGEYGQFEEAMATVDKVTADLEEQKNLIISYLDKLNDESIFAGDICNSCVEGFNNVRSKISLDVDNYETIKSYLGKSLANYQSADSAATTYLDIKDGKIFESDMQNSILTNLSLTNTGNTDLVNSLDNELGKRINDYNGFNDEAWCADFVSQKLKENGYDYKWSSLAGNEKEGILKSMADGGAEIHYGELAGKRGKTVDTNYTPQPGDVFTIDVDGDGSIDHTGFVVKDNGDGTITTVEGNTYKNGYEYDGGVVEKHTDRSKADVYAYATPSK